MINITNAIFITVCREPTTMLQFADDVIKEGVDVEWRKRMDMGPMTVCLICVRIETLLNSPRSLKSSKNM